MIVKIVAMYRISRAQNLGMQMTLISDWMLSGVMNVHCKHRAAQYVAQAGKQCPWKLGGGRRIGDISRGHPVGRRIAGISSSFVGRLTVVRRCELPQRVLTLRTEFEPGFPRRLEQAKIQQYSWA